MSPVLPEARTGRASLPGPVRVGMSRRRTTPSGLLIILAAALAVPAEPVSCSEAPRARTGPKEPPALSVLAEFRPIPLDLSVGRVLDAELEFGLDCKPPGAFRCSIRLPVTVRTALDGPWTGRTDAAIGDPSLEAGAFFRRSGGFWFLSAGYAAPLGRRTEDPDRPLRPAPGSGVHRVTAAAGLGRILDPAALTAGFSWTLSLRSSGDRARSWRPAGLGFSFSVVEVLSDRAGILLGVSPRIGAPARGPGAGPDSGWSWDLEARIEVHLRAGRLFFRTGSSRSLASPGSPGLPSAGVEYEIQMVPGGGS